MKRVKKKSSKQNKSDYTERLKITNLYIKEAKLPEYYFFFDPLSKQLNKFSCNSYYYFRKVVQSTVLIARKINLNYKTTAPLWSIMILTTACFTWYKSVKLQKVCLDHLSGMCQTHQFFINHRRGTPICIENKMQFTSVKVHASAWNKENNLNCHAFFAV